MGDWKKTKEKKEKIEGEKYTHTQDLQQHILEF